MEELKYFVNCIGTHPHCSHVSVVFDTYEEAKEFADRTRHRDYVCTIYNGIAIDEELRAKQDAAMEELTRLGQELQPECYK